MQSVRKLLVQTKEAALEEPTLCAVFEEALGHLEPQGAAWSWGLPRHLQGLCGPLALDHDHIDHCQVVPERKMHSEF